MFNLSNKKMPRKVMALCLLLSSSFFQAQAALEDFNVVTWNMQGSNAGTENKWKGNVVPLMWTGNANIILIQEAGQVPRTAELSSRQFTGPIPINEFTWNIGTRTRTIIRYIYFARVDQGANRVNLAIVSDRRADEVFTIVPRDFSVRPLIGIRIGGDAFFTAHASASGGGDAPRLVNAVDDFFRNNPNPDLRQTRWLLGGDFNRSPTSLLTALNRDFPSLSVQTVSTGQPTQASGGELDYAVVGNASTPVPLVGTLFLAQRLGQIASDHSPVGFTRGQQK